MIMILSPAKTIDMGDWKLPKTTEPVFLSRSAELVKELRTLSEGKLSSLMNISAKLAKLNSARYQSFTVPFTAKNAKPALLAFRGDVYQGMSADQYTSADFEFAQKHLRILSGLYGLLRPKDLIQPYRLEMKTKLKNKYGKDLYEFWGNDITEAINTDLKRSKNGTLVNLASNEYYQAIQPKLLLSPIITPVFKEKSGSGYKVVALFAKRARGMMADYAILNRLTRPSDLKDFSRDGYRFNAKLSTENEYTFTRAAKKNGR